MEDSANYAWSYFLKEKSKLKKVTLGFIKNLEIKYGIQVLYAHDNNARENVDLSRLVNGEGWGSSLSILLHVIPNRMAMLNGSLPPSLIGYMPHSKVKNFLLF